MIGCEEETMDVCGKEGSDKLSEVQEYINEQISSGKATAIQESRGFHVFCHECGNTWKIAERTDRKGYNAKRFIAHLVDRKCGNSTKSSGDEIVLPEELRPSQVSKSCVM